MFGARRYHVKWHKDEGEQMEDLMETLDELFEYFEMDDGEWPMAEVYDQGTFRQGIISDRLYEILIQLKELRTELASE